MTFIKTLKEVECDDGMTVTAVENTKKFETVHYYEIHESKDGIVRYVTNCTRTTWRRAFKRIAAEHTERGAEQ